MNFYFDKLIYENLDDDHDKLMTLADYHEEELRANITDYIWGAGTSGDTIKIDMWDDEYGKPMPWKVGDIITAKFGLNYTTYYYINKQTEDGDYAILKDVTQYVKAGLSVEDIKTALNITEI